MRKCVGCQAGRTTGGRRRPTQSVDEHRDDDQAHSPRHGCRERPLTPGDRHALIRGKLNDQRVADHPRDEHRAGNRSSVVRGQGQECARTRVYGRGRLHARKRLQDRKDHATCAPCVARNERGQHQVCSDKAVAQTKRAVAERPHERVRDASAQARPDEACGEEESRNDEPDGRVRKAAERLDDRERPRRQRGRDADDRNRAHRQRLQNHTDDRGDEDGQQPPRARVDCVGTWSGPDDDAGATDERQSPQPNRGLARRSDWRLDDYQLPTTSYRLI